VVAVSIDKLTWAAAGKEAKVKRPLQKATVFIAGFMVM
jgi:hypothetical protein